MSFLFSYPFTSPSNYIYDSDKIQIVGGKPKLKLTDNPGQDFTQEFTNDTGFVYDSDKAEFVGGVLRQKAAALLIDQSFGVSFYDSVNAQIGLGSLTGTVAGGAAIENNLLNLSGATAKSIYFDANLNADSQQTGCVMVKYIPTYSGSPPAIQYVFAICNTSSDVANMITVYHSSNGNIYIWVRDQNSTTIYQASKGTWNPVSGTTYFFQFNYNFTTGSQALYINGIQFGTAQTQTCTRSANINFFALGRSNITSNQYWNCGGAAVFSAPQSVVSDFPAGAVPNYRYSETVVTVPEMEYTGAGTLVSFDSFTATETGSPRYTLQIARSGDYLYWSGSAWVTSSGAYAQATGQTDFNTNCGDLNVNGQIYCQFKIVFPDSNTQSTVDELTASLTAQIYPIDNPTIEPTVGVSLEELVEFDATQTESGSDSVGYVMKKGNYFYYHNGSAWVVSDGTYSQSNTLAEIQANKATLTTTGISWKWKAFLHSGDGSSTPDIDIISGEYDFFAASEDVSVCTVWGYNLNADGTADTSPFTIQLCRDAIKYKDNTVLRNDIITVTPDASTGYWDAELIETVNMEPGSWYKFNFDGTVFSFYIDDEASKNIWDLTEVA